MKAGAVDYIKKPFDNDELVLIVRRALGEKTLQEENVYLKQELAARYTFANIIGKGSRMQEIFRTIERIGKVSSTVLITGESGTGKELIARAIHFTSDPEGQEVRLDQLRGAARDAPRVGALRPRARRLHRRGQGEAGSLHGSRQRHALPRRDLRDLPHDAGQAPARDPGEADPQGRRQRGDSASTSGSSPPRTRTSTSSSRRASSARTSSTASTSSRSCSRRCAPAPRTSRPLTQHFIAKVCKEQKIPEKKISAEAMRLIEAYPWPGNVRELENTLERTVALEPGPVINVSSLPESIALGVRTRVPDFESLPAEGHQPRGVPRGRRQAPHARGPRPLRRRADEGRGAAAHVVSLLPLLRQEVQPRAARKTSTRSGDAPAGGGDLGARSASEIADPDHGSRDVVPIIRSVNAPISFCSSRLVSSSPAARRPSPRPSPRATPAAPGPRVTMPSGAVYAVEIARTPEEQAQGLMYRESLPPRIPG